MTIWPSSAPRRRDAPKWPGPSGRVPSLRPPEWCFDPPDDPVGSDGLTDYGPHREWWARCVAWCDDADYSALDLLRLRRWRRGERVSRFPDDPPDLFLEAEFGIDRDWD